MNIEQGEMQATEFVPGLEQWVIRPAEQSEADAVGACAAAAYARYILAIGRPPAPMTADYVALIAEGEVHVAPAQDGSIAGMIVFFRRDDHMFLETVAVMPDFQGQGLGRRLIELCEAEARAKHLESVQLYTNEKMAPNLLLYPRLGYVERGRRYEDGFARVYFEKSLHQ